MPASPEEVPLLFVSVDETTGSPRRSHQTFGNNERYSRISEGAEPAFLQWPIREVSTNIFFAGVILLLVATSFIGVLAYAVFPSRPGMFLPSCSAGQEQNNSRIYIVHHGKWNEAQLDIMKLILVRYPEIPVQVLQLYNDTAKRRWNGLGVDAEVLSDNRSFKKLLNHAIIAYETEPLSSYFVRTPFYGEWKTFDWKMVDLAVRTMALWEFGGISIQMPYTATDELPILGNLSYYQRMPARIVNLDEKALRIETKTPCHVFFEEIIKNIHAAGESVDTVLRNALKKFCAHGDVPNGFCGSL